MPGSLLRGKGKVKDATISDGVHISFLDMKLVIIAFVIINLCTKLPEYIVDIIKKITNS